MWVKLDDQFCDHPKVVAAGSAAGWLYVSALCYAARLLTDGYIPANMVNRLADCDDPQDAARRLVAVGLWEPAEGGYVIHDYHDYQPSSAKVKGERDAAKQRMAARRSSPEPQPNIPRTSPERTANVARAAYPEAFEAFWTAYPKGHGVKKSTYAQWQRIAPDPETVEDIMYGLRRWCESDRWQRGFVKSADIWLRDRYWENDPPASVVAIQPRQQAQADSVNYLLSIAREAQA